jgi:hypothetical protein
MMAKSRRIRWLGLVAHVKEERERIYFLMENLNQREWTWMDNITMDALGSSNRVRFHAKIWIL